jgi:hypothetical protein
MTAAAAKQQGALRDRDAGEGDQGRPLWGCHGDDRGLPLRSTRRRRCMSSRDLEAWAHVRSVVVQSASTCSRSRTPHWQAPLWLLQCSDLGGSLACGHGRLMLPRKREARCPWHLSIGLPPS